MGTSDPTAGSRRKTGLDTLKSTSLRRDLPDDADTCYWEEAFTKTKQNPLFVVTWWNVLASLPRHLTFKA